MTDDNNNEKYADEIYVVLTIDDNGDEGIVSIKTEQGNLLLVTSSKKVLTSTISLVKNISQDTNKTFYIHKYKKDELLHKISEENK